MAMGSLRHQFLQLGFHQNLPKPHLRSSAVPQFSTPNIICGLRSRPRKPLWRSSVLSTEAIQAVQALKLAKSGHKLEQVFSRRLSRLLKADLLDTFAELQRQNELDLALKVFKFIHKEAGYKPELSLYCGMILFLGKNKLIDKAEELFSELMTEDLEPDTSIFTEMIGAYIQVGMIEKAMETYKLMKASGCNPDKLTFMILIRNLEKAGEKEMAATMKKECVDYVDYPEKFLQEVEHKQVKIKSPDLV